jgi:hypothetical protein
MFRGAVEDLSLPLAEQEGVEHQGVAFGSPGGKVKFLFRHTQNPGAAGTGVFQVFPGLSAFLVKGRRVPESVFRPRILQGAGV